MSMDRDEDWIQELDRLHRPAGTADEGDFLGRVEGRIKGRNRVRAGALSAAVLFVVAFGLLQDFKGDDGPAKEDAQRGALVELSVESPTMESTNEPDLATGESGPSMDEFAYDEMDLFGDAADIAAGIDGDWAAFDQSLGDEYLAFSELLDSTIIEESL